MIAVSILYAVIFFRNKDSKVYINDLLLDGAPTSILDRINFVLMFKHVYPESGPLQG